MCRSFLPDPIAPELVDRLLDLATRAPSAGHTQGWSWLVLSSPASVENFWTATSSSVDLVPPGVRSAPVIVIPLCSSAAYADRYAQSDKVSFEWEVPFWMVDTGMASMILLLAAEDAGLGALFFRLHKSVSEVRSAFAVPAEWSPIGAVALGWPSPDAVGDRGRRRRRLGDVVHRETW